MPPKLRRPAAAAAKAAGRRREGLRRPGADVEKDTEGDEVSELDCSALSLDQCRAMKDVVITDGSYWDAPVPSAVQVKEVRMRDGQLYLQARVLGTKNEDLLKLASGHPNQMVEVHLCPRECAGTPHEEGLLHARKVRHLGAHREGWMSNLVQDRAPPAPLDELEEARLDRARLGRLAPREDDRGDLQVGDSPPRAKAKDKQKRSRSGRRKSERLKLEAKKDIKVILGSTGADPDPKVRRRFRKKATKLARRKSKESKGDSSETTSASSSVMSGDRAIFGSSNRVHSIGRQFPGVLLSAALEEATDALITQEGGVYDTQTGSLPPMFSRYHRQQLAPRMSPAMARESQTLSYMLDLGLRGRVVECLDVGAQRLKSLEMMMTGAHFTVAQQVELLPKDGSSMSTVPEFTEASKRAREEGRARLEASRPYGTRSAGGGRPDEWTKGSGKKGAPKGKGGKTETRKGESEKQADAKKPKGG